MALPKIETPTYVTKIPSTNDQVEFRPFLVKEEKILLLAQESKSTIEITRAMKNIIKACLFDKVNVNTLTSYDLEYLFLQLRAKSVGETIELSYKCSECGAVNDIIIPLDEVQLIYPEKKVSNKVKVTDDIGITLKYLTLRDLENPVFENPSNENIVESLSFMIETIYDANDVYEAKNTSKKELIEFIEQLPHSALMAIKDFSDSVPKLRYETSFKCVKCGHENKVVIEGLESFFM